MRARSGVVAALFVALGAIASCREPTSIEIDVRTNLAASDMRGTVFVVAGTAAEAVGLMTKGSWSAVTNAVDGDGHVGTLVAVPHGGGGGGGVSIVVIAGYGRAATSCAPPKFDGCIVARRQLSYRAHARLRLPIALDLSCANVPCDELSTCANGKCVSAQTTCDDDDGCRLEAPAASGEDGGTPDAGGEGGAEGDALVDGPTQTDAKPDGPVPGDAGGDANSGGIANICPAPTAIDCYPNICCYTSSNNFQCGPTAACSVSVYKFQCTGRLHCAASEFCCSESTPETSHCATDCVLHTLCNSDADCPVDIPKCTKRFFPGGGAKYLSECQ